MKGMFRTEDDGKTHYYIDSVEVTEKKFHDTFQAPASTGRVGDSLVAWKRPVLSDALAVHPAQIAEASEYNRANGVPTDYAPDGRAIITDRDHKRRLCNLLGAFDRDGGYGDAQKGSSRAARNAPPEEKADYSHLTEGLFKEKIDYRGVLRGS